ncbi:SHOCT domain-containing protein [Nocardia camponoti]|uniref:SHOCT domain-containing protein n=1 Tax=Nocardia camponoti TaxID=1616106 RepID=A0A917Q878_9NOCA|nr:SHOCT domain-containing protein [Nocardia camponoti]GGK34712.1 hypothetical protein GCM10011591_02920 [Nocardia camponoti]
MPLIGRRMGRPGLLGAAARTAVVAGTATATSNAVNNRARRRAAEQDAYADQQQQAAYAQQQAAYQQPQYAPPSPPQAAPGEDDVVAKLERLGKLHSSGVLSDAEFAAAKAKLLS